jgi:ATP-binding cassette subfamily B protein
MIKQLRGTNNFMKQLIIGYRKMLQFLKPYWLFELVAFGLTIVATLSVIQYSVLIKVLIDDVLTPKRLEKLLPLSLLFIGIVLLSIIANLLKSYFFSLIGQKIIVDLRTKLFNHILDLPQSFFTKTGTGDIISRINSDVENVNEVISNTAVDIITSIITLVGVVFWILFIDWRMTLLIIVIIPVFMITSKALNKQLWEKSKVIQEKRSKLIGIVHESVTGAELLKVFSIERVFKEKFRNESIRLAKDLVKLSVRSNIANSLGQIVLLPYQTILFGMAGYWYITEGKPTIGMLFAFLNYMGILIPAAMTLLGVFSKIAEALASFHRIAEYLSMASEKVSNLIHIDNIKGEIYFNNVSFSYDCQCNLEIENLRIDSGEVIALVGPTGAGKTTIARLLLGLYRPQQGQIFLDGKNIEEYDLESLRKHIGIVSQESFLFNISIKENLLLGKLDASLDEIYAATHKAQIHDFILSLPQGYDTVVGERGITLSGGEKQRLSIARTILKKPDLLILDEPTSAIDNITDRALMDLIGADFKGKTVIIIAHRLSNIQKADKIVVLDKGKVIQDGCYNELLQSQGLFAALYKAETIA